MQGQCQKCGALIETTPESDQQADAELQAAFPGVERSDCIQVCDECYEKIMSWARREGLTTMKATEADKAEEAMWAQKIKEMVLAHYNTVVKVAEEQGLRQDGLAILLDAFSHLEKSVHTISMLNRVLPSAIYSIVILMLTQRQEFIEFVMQSNLSSQKIIEASHSAFKKDGTSVTDTKLN